jgi:hypothetical protein
LIGRIDYEETFVSVVRVPSFKIFRSPIAIWMEAYYTLTKKLNINSSEDLPEKGKSLKLRRAFSGLLLNLVG